MKLQLKRSNVLEGGQLNSLQPHRWNTASLPLITTLMILCIFIKNSDDAVIRIAGAGATLVQAAVLVIVYVMLA